jgi:hypothetical protein
MQRLTIVRYKAKQDRLAEDERLVSEVFDRLRGDGLKGVSYATFLEADGQSVVHLFVNHLDVSQEVLTDLPEFKAFGAAISERLEAPAEIDRLSVVLQESYNFPTA